MSKKKIMLSVTASAAIAAAIMGAEETSAATHKVESGETLWSIAQKYGTSVSHLQSINNLSTQIIYPNQVIHTTGNMSTNDSSQPKASSHISTKTSSTSTYTVKAGDTLSSIANRHGVSLQNILSWNNLDTTLIYPGNVLYVQKPGNNQTSSVSTPTHVSVSATSTSNENSNTSTTSPYVVKSGDTLSRIANQHNVSVANIKKWNNLSSNIIFIGQKLNLNGAVASSPTVTNTNNSTNSNTQTDYNVTELISIANNLIGTPYIWGGVTTSGFDCSGFVHYVYNQAGKSLGRYSTDGYFDRSHYVTNPEIGDLVFFSNTYRSGISHMGIYIGNNQFIHAGTSTGVAIANLSSSYWSKHFDSFKRFY